MHKITEDHTREKGIQGVWRLFGQIRVAQQSIVEGLAGAYDDFVIYIQHFPHGAGVLGATL